MAMEFPKKNQHGKECDICQKKFLRKNMICHDCNNPMSLIKRQVEDEERPRKNTGHFKDSLASPDKKVRNITIQDTTGEMPVALWNTAALSPVKTGETIKMTHMVAKYNNFHKSLALNTTTHTTIQLTEQQNTTAQITIIGIEPNTDHGFQVTTMENDSIKDYFMEDDVAETTFKDLDVILDSLEEQDAYTVTIQGLQIISAAPTAN
ncbi:uncharacterized protein [Amphiura filiformis]|uniref:uncharacterized protein n=1 Tax=Amphiura filiformis TaxID=82378 RepID=UPI003B21A37C